MKAFRQLFRPWLVEENGDPVPFKWVGNAHHAVCLNPNSARIYAILSHDGYRKYYPTIYVSMFEACRIFWREPVVSFGLRNFPRCALELLRFKCRSMTDAQECLHELLVDLKLI
jgi:hypothetical protein